MTVDINYWWLCVIAIGAVLLIIWLIKRNHKDQKALEKEIIESDLKPERHDNEDDKTVRH